MKPPYITVLIDTYNYGHFIEHAIESVLSQDFPMEQREILVVDDGSKDDTAERVSKYATAIKYLRKPNGGQASAFNFGFERARGEIIALLDADDYWLSGKLKRLRSEFEKYPEAGLVYHRLRELDARTGIIRDAHFTAISGFVPSALQHVLLFNALTTTGLAFRRDVIERLLPIPEVLTIQADAYLATLTTFLAPVVAIDEPLAVYRIHGDNLYFQADDDINADRLRRRITTRRALAEKLEAWFVSHGFDTNLPEVRASVLRWILLSERDEFTLSPPSRLRFFRHLLKSFKHNDPLMTRRIRLVNYVNAIGSLIVGYDNFHVLDETREKLTHRIKTLGQAK